MKSWYQIKFKTENLADDTAEVMIYDNIGSYGVTAAQFRTEFNGIKAAKIDLRINSYGGECFDAEAICCAIREHPAQVTAHVDGVAASAASVIACACDSVQIGKNAFMMIHNASSGAYGYASDLRQTADLLDKLSGAIAQIYVEKTGKNKEAVAKAMDDETWFDAAEAKEWGLADCIKNDDEGDGAEMAAQIAAMNAGGGGESVPLLFTKFKNVPERVRRMVAQATHPKPAAQETSMLNVINRDGKQFVTIDGKEHEIAPTNAPHVAKLGKSDEEVAAAAKAAVDAALKAEREYRAMFNTALSTAGLTGEAAQKFEADFYGKCDEKQIKFLVSSAVALRAGPVGEGSGMTEEQQKLEAQKKDNPAAAAEAAAGKRFDEESSLRRSYGVTTNDTASDQYKSMRGRHVAAARRRFLSENPAK